MTATLAVDVRHGYTLTDLEQMTRAACIADRTLAMDWDTKHGIAYSAIALALCEADTPPHRGDLIRTGWQAIYADVRETQRSQGIRDNDGVPGPKFAMYWQQRLTAPSPEHRIVERTAAHQILATLDPIHATAVVALAVHDDYQLAAQALGVTYTCLRARLATARRQWNVLWLQWETPPRWPHTRRTDRRVGAYGKEPATHCSKNHEWTVQNTHIHHGMKYGKPFSRRVCRTCQAARSKARRAAGAS